MAFLGVAALLIANASGVGTFLSVAGLVKTQSLYEFDSNKALEGATAGIVDVLDDPYSKYLNNKEWADLKSKLEAEFGGIGIYIVQDKEKKLRVVAPIKGTPAERAGLEQGDIIISVNGESTAAMSQDDAVHLMRGDPGTQVILGIYRESESREIEFKIVREIINVPSVEDKVLEQDPRIGYISLNQFHARSAREMTQSVNRLAEKNVKGLILDLRDNGGGDFEASIAIAGIFLDNKVVVSVADARGNKTVDRSSKGSIKIPLVVLVNNNSASASEILAGALRDNKRAVLVGEQTYGKGVVQTIYPLRNGGALKLTTQEYFTPNGTDINKIGIHPDYVVQNKAGEDKDAQLEKAITVLQGRF
ncbi:MAG TPA: S41 family peptidase [Syntrophomonas sp.]|nr:S41 family peptidase [Syntrophomonas sp.]